jgi:hypothetical protein
MNKIFVTSFIALLQSLVFAQSNDLETPVSIINDGLDTHAQMGSIFTLNGTNSYDPNGTIVSYYWSQSPNGTQVDFSSENDSIVTYIMPTESDANPNMPGGSGDVICIIWLTVTDNDGLTNMSQITITGVEGGPPVSIINDGSSNVSLQIGSQFTLDGSNSYDLDGTIIQYSWSQSQNGDQVAFSSTDEAIVTFIVPEESPNDISDSLVTCIIYLTVTDNDGNTDVSQITVTGILSDGTQQLDSSIEGRWFSSGFDNTMYEFLDGLRYTYYCSEDNGCDSTYWNSLDTSDAIPNPDLYTFINDTLTIDGGSGSFIDFECDGNIILSGDDIVLWRVGLDTSDCENQLEVVFTKQDSADWTLPENQDRIAENVWITRKHNQSIFNIAQEDGYSGSNGSPLGTLWAYSSTENTQSSDYTSFVTMHGGNPQSIINDTVSLYLPDYERYFDLVFLSFSGGNSGGGFSYMREEVFPTHFETETIEGKWLVPLYEGDPINTMYEFIDGLRYTYYCAEDNGCDSTYWNSLDTSDAIPNPNPYTFTNDTLSINLFFGNTWQQSVTFECDGNIISFSDTTFHEWWRVELDTSECEDQELGFSNIINTPEKFRLNQNYPNPFNPITSLSYDLLKDSYVRITVYDMLGNVVNNLISTYQSSGYKTVQWNATNNQGQPVSAGVYLYSLEAGNFRQTKKMILLK